MKLKFREYEPDEREIRALEELLPHWQQYESVSGKFPFKNWGIEELFSCLVEIGIKRYVNCIIKEDQYRKEMISLEEYCSHTPFRLKEERDNGRWNITNESIEKVLCLSGEGVQMIAENGQVYQILDDKEECDAVRT